MLGGGDQIYNDGLPKRSKLFKAWLQISNLHHKFSTPFSKELADEMEEFYLLHYCEVSSLSVPAYPSGFIKGSSATVILVKAGTKIVANAQIPMVNIYDDHDIIDGFGSYPALFNKCEVFSNLGRVAYKYYILFQHQTAPEDERGIDPSIIFGSEPGPYMREYSRSIATWLGKDVLFVGDKFRCIDSSDLCRIG
jgi:PhoD related phosphatase